MAKVQSARPWRRQIEAEARGSETVKLLWLSLAHTVVVGSVVVLSFWLSH